MKRRTLLIAGFSSVILRRLPRPLVAALSGHWAYAVTEADAECYLTQLFSEADAPRAVGRLYLGMYSHEADRARLLIELIGSAQPSSPEEWRTLLARRRSRDFQDGNVVLVDGWVLARTEARACALIALL